MKYRSTEKVYQFYFRNAAYRVEILKITPHSIALYTPK